ncbi:hypothetical protein [Pseudoalteromonas sp. Xi13]|jgi:hypothetical protein|uniref:hypothetical protein n=1 Tax=Pseudoalteromonas sp. Xi13 TaxID=2490635 RepID=UPI000F74C722|nr:hypothetical protein [Pseudoalteromonas sp. Xi13]AZN32294.1 hypothetical protein EJ103_05945 [Pseudoalteromonas sp. Xi13]
MSENHSFDNITSENSFWKLYLQLRKVKSSKTNIAVFIFSLILTFTSIYFTENNIPILKEQIYSISGNLITWSVSLVGFVLAGYAIYATLAEKEMQVAMSIIQDDKTNLDFLKSTHCVFIKICVDMLAIAFLIFILSSKPFIQFLDLFLLLNILNQEVYQLILVLIFSLLHAMFILILMLTRSFIYNVYHSVMVAIRWHAEKDSEPN